jgi:two-component system sensor histidine kinase UhpB
MPLRFQLMIIVAVGLIVSLALGGGVAWWNAASTVETELASALTVSERVARNTLDHLPEGSQARYIEQLVATFDGNRHVRAALLDGEGRSVVISSLPPAGEAAPAWFFDLVGVAPAALRIDLPGALVPYQALTLTADAHNEVAEVWLRLRDDILIMGGLAMVTFLLVYLIVGRGLKPLRALTSGLRTIEDGGYDTRVRADGPRETRSLARSFNHMAEHLERLEARNRVLTAQLLTIQEEERADLARDLHDEVGPFLFSVNVDAAAIAQATDPAARTKILPYVNSIKSAVTHMQKHVRAILERLRPPSLADVGLAQAIENLGEFWRRTHSDLQVGTALNIPANGFGEACDEAIYRLVQEALSNAVLHGHAGAISIAIVVEAGEIRVSVSDDGTGLKDQTRGGYGLMGMRERVAALGGAVGIANRPDDNGTLVSARIPIDAGLARAS